MLLQMTGLLVRPTAVGAFVRSVADHDVQVLLYGQAVAGILVLHKTCIKTQRHQLIYGGPKTLSTKVL